MNLKTVGLLLVPITFLLFISSFVVSENDCDLVKVEAKVVHSTDGQNNGSITLSLEGVSGKRKIHVIGGSPGQNQLNLKSNQINNLSSGVYDIVVQDPSGCTKAIKVTVN